ncbi:MAG: GFA family protein [Gammaproteobacteria bacterium]|nr:GFA family protein [Gammaproteobacteria bacterium]
MSVAPLKSAVAREGGCLCGGIRYRIEGVGIDAGYCHCRLCQRSAGAPVLAWMTVPVAAFSYIAGAPSIYRSSPHSQREFCARCGTQLAFRRLQNARTVDVTLASLDNPAGVIPEYHIWCASRIPWFDTRDALPRHQDAGPDRHD